MSTPTTRPAYLGRSDTFDRTIADYAMDYAELSERDHAELRLAADEGRIIARGAT